MEAVERVVLFGNLFYVCLAIAAIGLICAIIFFISFDIPAMFALKAGKTTKKRTRKNSDKAEVVKKSQMPSITGGLTGETTSADLKTEADKQKAEILNPNMLEETPLPETTLLTPETTAEAESVPQEGVTAPLVRKQDTEAHQFTITQSIVLIHTDEII